jgi:hypothetical protein
MRPAPPLVVDGEPSRLWRLGCALVTAAAGAAIAAWVSAHAEARPPWPAVAALLAAMAGAALARRIAGSAQRLHIGWDGAAWQVGGIVGEMQLMLDLGSPLLLLRHKPTRGRARWIALSAAHGTGDLHALRIALYSRPPKATPTTPATSAVRAPDRATD